MTAQVKVPPLPAGPWFGQDGVPTQAFRTWCQRMLDRTGGTSDSVYTALVAALTALPNTTEVVAFNGLQFGGALDGNVPIALYSYVGPVSGLPTTGNSTGDWAYATDGRNSGEGAGSGTGCPVVWRAGGGGQWRIPGVSSAVAA